MQRRAFEAYKKAKNEFVKTEFTLNYNFSPEAKDNYMAADLSGPYGPFGAENPVDYYFPSDQDVKNWLKDENDSSLYDVQKFFSGLYYALLSQDLRDWWNISPDSLRQKFKRARNNQELLFDSSFASFLEKVEKKVEEKAEEKAMRERLYELILSLQTKEIPPCLVRATISPYLQKSRGNSFRVKRSKKRSRKPKLRKRKKKNSRARRKRR